MRNGMLCCRGTRPRVPGNGALPTRTPRRGVPQLVKKASQSFAAAAAKEIKNIFCRGVYLAENTSQAASVEFGRQRRTNYARSRLQSFCRKSPKGFFDSLTDTPEGCPYGGWGGFGSNGQPGVRRCGQARTLQESQKPPRTEVRGGGMLVREYGISPAQRST